MRRLNTLDINQRKRLLEELVVLKTTKIKDFNLEALFPDGKETIMIPSKSVFSSELNDDVWIGESRKIDFFQDFRIDIQHCNEGFYLNIFYTSILEKEGKIERFFYSDENLQNTNDIYLQLILETQEFQEFLLLHT